MLIVRPIPLIRDAILVGTLALLATVPIQGVTAETHAPPPTLQSANQPSPATAAINEIAPASAADGSAADASAANAAVAKAEAEREAELDRLSERLRRITPKRNRQAAPAPLVPPQSGTEIDARLNIIR